MPDSARQFQNLILAFFIFINISTLFVVLHQGALSGDAAGEPLLISPFTLILLAVVGLCGFLLIQGAGRLQSEKKLVQIDRQNLLIWVEIFIVLALALKVLGFLFFGYGAAESRSNISFGFVFRLIPTYILFIMLFVLPEKMARRYIFYVVVHVLTMLAMGWTGGLFDIFWLSVFRYLRKPNNNRFRLFLFIGLVLIAFLFAPYIYALKFYIRWGDQFDFSYVNVLSHLLSRLSYFPSTVYAFQSGGAFENFASQYLLPGFTVFDSITSVLPRSLLGIQMENLETVYVKVITGDFNEGIVFYLSLPGKIIASGYISGLDLLVTIVMFLFISLILFTSLRLVFGTYAIVPWSLITYKWYLSGSFEEPSYYLYGLILMLIVSRIRLMIKKNSLC